MKINEVTDDRLDYIKDLLTFLNIKNVKQVATASVLKELEKAGVSIDFEELAPLLKELNFISDISQDTITFKSLDSSPLVSDEKLDMDKDTVASMAKRARRRRENN